MSQPINEDILYSGTCLYCYEVHLDLEIEELKAISDGKYECSVCGRASSWHIVPIGPKRPKGKAKPQRPFLIAERLTKKAMEREMDAFAEQLESWLLTPEGQFAQVMAERDRRGHA